MKPTAVLLTVILLMAGLLLVGGGSCITKVNTEAVNPDSNIISPEVSSKEEKAVPAVV